MELYHHGVKGQRWGIRRYQNEDGTLTSAGKKRYSSALSKASEAYSKEEQSAVKAFRNGKPAVMAYNKMRTTTKDNLDSIKGKLLDTSGLTDAQSRYDKAQKNRTFVGELLGDRKFKEFLDARDNLTQAGKRYTESVVLETDLYISQLPAKEQEYARAYLYDKILGYSW